MELTHIADVSDRLQVVYSFHKFDFFLKRSLCMTTV